MKSIIRNLKKTSFALLFLVNASLILLTSCEKTEEDLIAKQGVANKSASAIVSPPSGFYLIQSAKGVELYRKNYTGGQPDFVQVVDLTQGAKLQVVQGSDVLASPAYPNPQFYKHTIQWYWDNYSYSPTLFSVTNAQFFATNYNPTSLAYPIVRADGKMVSAGYGNGESFPKRKLEIFSNWARISDYTNTSNDYWAVDNALENVTAIVGLHPENADKSKYSRVGRTFVGLKNSNILMVFTSRYATQAEARQALVNFGCSWTMMLDGGGSTQMITKGNKYVPSTDGWEGRPLPSILATYSGF